MENVIAKLLGVFVSMAKLNILCRKKLHQLMRLCAIGVGIFALVASTANAEPFQLSSSMPVSAPVGYSSVLEDKTGALSSAEVIQGRHDSEFHALSGNRSSMGITSSAWWVKFEAFNPTDQSIKWVLNVPFPSTDIVDAYHIPESGLPETFLLGDTRPLFERPLPGEGFAIPLVTQPKSHSTIYLRLKFASSGAIDTYFEISSPESYTESQRVTGMILGFLMGGALLMFIYNAVIFLAVKSKVYVWYLLYLSAVLATFITTTGLGNRFLWSHTSILGDAMPVLAASFLFLFAVQFCRVLLDSRRIAPRVDRLLLVFIALFLGSVLIYFAGYRGLAIKITLSVGMGLGILPVVGAWLWMQGSRIALIFTLAWSVWAITVTTMIARYLGLVPSNDFTLRAAWVGIIVEAMLFALALADRIRILQIEKEGAERGERLALERSKAELERLVETRTAEIQSQNQELASLSKQKDRFFSIIAHDLIGPFNSLIGLSGLLVAGGDSLMRSKIREYSQDLNTTATNLYKLVENLLSWAMLQQGKLKFSPVKLNIQDSVQSSIDIFKAAASQKDITIHYSDSSLNSARSPIFVRADRQMVDIITRNLLNNAIKFTHAGGKVSCYLEPNAHWVNVSIHDNGIGMTPEHIGLLFDLGEVTNKLGTAGEGGTGLGLQLCKEMVELHGGQIEIKSEREKGSTFSFTLPMEASAQSIN